MKYVFLCCVFIFMSCDAVFAGTGTLSQIVGPRVRKTDINDVRTATYQNWVPRNSSGVATDDAGSLGTSLLRWSDLFLGPTASGIALKEVAGDLSIEIGDTEVVNISSAGLAGAGIVTGSITTTQMGTNSVDTDEIVALAIETSKINASAVTTDKINGNAVTRDKLAAVGEQISASSGSFSTTSSSTVDITNLSVTLTTTGRPVRLFLQGTNSIGINNIRCEDVSANGTCQGIFNFDRGGTVISAEFFGVSGGTQTDTFIPSSSFSALDVVVAGTYTYKGRIKINSASDTVHVTNVKLVAYEL